MLLPFAVESNREWEQRRETGALTYALVGVSLVAHIVVWHVLPDDARLAVFYRLGVVKFDFRWYSPLTCTLLHADWLHLIGNLFYLWVFGAGVERLLGRWRFLALYVIGAWVSVAVHLATLPAAMIDVPTIGASGAVSAVLGAFFVLLPKAKLKCAFIVFLRPLIANLPAWVVLGLWFVLQLYLGADPLASAGNVAVWAHIGGFCLGALLGGLADWELRHRHHQTAKLWREPLHRAWNAWLRNDFPNAIEAYDEFRELATFPGPEDDTPLAALLRPHRDDAPHPGRDMAKAFSRLLIAFNLPGALTVYLHMVRHLPPPEIPPELHRQAGEAALSCQQPELALQAFARAFQAGLDEGADDVLRRAEAAARHKLNDAALADNLAAVAASCHSVGGGSGVK